jgi:hypothetical protein
MRWLPWLLLPALCRRRLVPLPAARRCRSRVGGACGSMRRAPTCVGRRRAVVSRVARVAERRFEGRRQILGGGRRQRLHKAVYGAAEEHEVRAAAALERLPLWVRCVVEQRRLRRRSGSRSASSGERAASAILVGARCGASPRARGSSAACAGPSAQTLPRNIIRRDTALLLTSSSTSGRACGPAATVPLPSGSMLHGYRAI